MSLSSEEEQARFVAEKKQFLLQKRKFLCRLLVFLFLSFFILLVSDATFRLEEFKLDELDFILEHFTETELNALPRTISPAFKNDYHVATVAHFLVSLYGQQFEPYLMLFPQSTLEGFVNASHFVKLPNGSCLDSSDAKLDLACGLSAPTNFVKGSGRFVIDRALLQLGLTRQCAFSLPPNNFGIDGIIPVCLKKNDSKGRALYTFIAIQVKSDEKVDFEHVLKMQSRLHFVNCPRADLHQASSHPFVECTFCSKDEEIKEIYQNQIGLIVSFGDEYKRVSGKGSLIHYTFPGPNSPVDVLGTLKKLYPVDDHLLSPQARQMISNSEVGCKERLVVKSTCPPRIIHQVDVNRKIRLLSCIWNEGSSAISTSTSTSASGATTTEPTIQAVEVYESEDEEDAEISAREGEDQNPRPKKAKIVKPLPSIFKPFTDDQRLFCISSRGFDVFKHLFANEGTREKEVEIAKMILNPDWVIGDDSTIDLENMVAGLLNESLLPEYNEYLMRARRGRKRNGKASSDNYLRLMRILAEASKGKIAHHPFSRL